MTKAEVKRRIIALEHISGSSNPILGLLHYDQPSMQFTFKDQTYDVDGLTKLFKENPCLFVLCEPSGDSYDRGYGGFIWVVGAHFAEHGYMSVEDFLEHLKAEPEPIDVLRGAKSKNE